MDHFYRLALRVELDDLHKIGTDEIGDEVVSPEILKSWFDHNADMFWLLIERRIRLRPIRRQTEESVGYFILIPLNDSAAKSVEKGDLRAYSFTADHIPKPRELPAAIYLGAVCARPGKGRLAVMNYLRIEMRAWLKKGVRLYLTRPVSQRGLDLAKVHGFESVNPLRSEETGIIVRRVFREGEAP